MSDIAGNGLVEKGESISSKVEFVAFLDALLRNHDEHHDEWENTSISEFLSGMKGFADNMEGYYSNIGSDINAEVPSWRLFADVLMAGRVYE